MLTQIGYENNNDILSAYRGTKYEYYPNNTATTYLVSLPARQVTLDCTSGSCDFTNLTGKQAETSFFYDGATTYNTLPIKGDLTRQRVWVQNDDYSQTSFTMIMGI